MEKRLILTTINPKLICKIYSLIRFISFSSICLSQNFAIPAIPDIIIVFLPSNIRLYIPFYQLYSTTRTIISFKISSSTCLLRKREMQEKRYNMRNANNSSTGLTFTFAKKRPFSFSSGFS